MRASLPTRTLPNERLVGATFSKTVGAAVAVPETGIAAKVFEALLTTARLPLNVPAACGANWIVRGPDCPAFRMNGKPGAVTVKTAAPVRVACETVRGEPPVLVITTACDDLVVAGMLLNVTLVGETAIAGGGKLTVTIAEADFVGSATLLAVTVNVPAVLGAV